MQHGCLTAHVLADAVDLIAGDVELVAAFVGEQQIVALDAANGALDHAFVVADTVLVVHHIVAGLEVFEEATALALARAGLAMRAAATGEIAFGDHRHLGRRNGETAMQRSGDHVATGTAEIGVRFGDLEVEAAVE